MADDSPPGRFGARLERLLFGERARLYRQFVRATVVVTVGLLGAYAVARSGVLGLSPATVTVLGTAAAVAVAVFALSGVVEFVVLGRVYQEGTSEMAHTAVELERAAEQVEATADHLESTADVIEDAAETVDEAAEEVVETADPDEAADTAAEVKERADDAKETAARVAEDAQAAKEVAERVEETAASERERLPQEPEQASDGEA